MFAVQTLRPEYDSQKRDGGGGGTMYLYSQCWEGTDAGFLGLTGQPAQASERLFQKTLVDSNGRTPPEVDL